MVAIPFCVYDCRYANVEQRALLASLVSFLWKDLVVALNTCCQSGALRKVKSDLARGILHPPYLHVYD